MGRGTGTRGTTGDRMEEVSPYGASYFARGGKVTKTPPGAAHAQLRCANPPPPDPEYEGRPT